MEKPILDPSVPYIGPIYGGKFGPGRMVRIQGTIPSVAYRFDVNLQCGPETSPRDDIAIQLSVHLLDGYICLNSLQNGVWGEEQRHLSVPIKRAERFEIIIMCEYNQYKVAINGQHYCEVPQRIHYDRLTYLSIDGDVSIIQITYESSGIGGSTSESSNIIPEEDDFQLVGAASTRGPPPVIYHSQGQTGYPSHPPPYNNQPVNTYPPYSSTTSPAQYPTPTPPYPTDGPYPTGVPVVVGRSPIPPPGAPYIPPPARGAPIPLNANSPHFRSVSRKYENRWCFCFGLAVIIAFGMFVMLLAGFLV